VRQRANFACEFCGVRESDVAGELTIDHFRPSSHGGGESYDNLLYCCHRCNLYKADYWPVEATASRLWNPRAESSDRYFVQLHDGMLLPLSATGGFTIERLRLNRPPLLQYRKQRQLASKQQRLAQRISEIVRLLESLHEQQETLLREQQLLLQLQQRLLEILIGE
jgi:hypothetical protein